MHPAKLVGRARAALALAAVGLAICGMAGTATAQVDSDDEKGQEQPKWEVGVGAGWAWTPHYPAADQNNTVFLGLPYFAYRWERVKVGGGGLLTGRLFENERLDLTLSIGGALPAKSRNNEARAGMPNLDTMVELGPRLDVTLAERVSHDSWKLRLPLRAVVSTDFHGIDYRGVVFKPQLTYRRKGLAGGALEATLSGGPIFASGLLMDYFYGVPPLYATPTRPAYNAHGGYLGSALNAGVSYDVSDRFRVVAGGQVAYYGGAENEDSPLFRDTVGFSLGVGVVWKVWISDERVRR